MNTSGISLFAYYARVVSVATLLTISLSGCPEMNDPYYDRGYDSRYERDLDRRERQLDRERDRLEDEQEEFQREQERQRRTQPPAARQDRCPSGFSPSERKCSREERARGCRDMRLPSGLGCVSR